MPNEKYELSDDALENVLGGVSMEEVKGMSLQELEKLAQQQEQKLQNLPVNREGEPGTYIDEVLENFREDYQNALGRVDQTANLLKEQVDNLLKINAEISRNI